MTIDSRAKSHAYYLAHKDKWREYGRRGYEKRREKMLVYNRANAWRYRGRYRDRQALYRRRWRAKHPDVALAAMTRRIARVRGAPGSFTAKEWREKVALLGGVCIYCGEARPLEPDHKTPLSRGGSNDITNIVPACRACNARKNARTASEYLAEVA